MQAFTLSEILFQPYEGYLGYFCPGCDKHHHVRIIGDGNFGSGWNNDLTFPTFNSPIQIKEYEPARDGGPIQIKHWCLSTIKDGLIHFSPLCTHRLAGQRVLIPAHQFKQE